MGLSENVVYPKKPMVLLIIIPTKWLFHWGVYPTFSDIPKYFQEFTTFFWGMGWNHNTQKLSQFAPINRHLQGDNRASDPQWRNLPQAAEESDTVEFFQGVMINM